MTYRVNEIFYSIQGEGYWTGRPAVFCRFSRCNLWSGHEADRTNSICKFCDTDFTEFTEQGRADLTAAIEDHWPTHSRRMVVLTGGEPAQQLDNQLIKELQYRGFYTAVETNGTLPLPDVDWVCVSPKTPKLRVKHGQELKLVYPQERITPDMFADLDFKHFWLSPMDGPNLADNTAAALNYCLAHPQWRLNIQTHKVIGAR